MTEVFTSTPTLPTVTVLERRVAAGAPLDRRGQPGEPRSCLALSSVLSFARRSLSTVSASRQSK
jgi:hypothetical protein